MNTIEIERSEAGRDKFIQHVSDLIRAGQAFVALAVDKEGHLTVASMGIKPGGAPTFLRDAAKHIDRQAYVDIVRDAVESLPPDRRSQCPACETEVILARPAPRAALASEEPAACVCGCGAFLVPSLDDSERLQLRCMSEAEVAALPDDMRNELLRERRRRAERQAG